MVSLKFSSRRCFFFQKTFFVSSSKLVCDLSHPCGRPVLNTQQSLHGQALKYWLEVLEAGKGLPSAHVRRARGLFHFGCPKVRICRSFLLSSLASQTAANPLPKDSSFSAGIWRTLREVTLFYSVYNSLRDFCLNINWGLTL